MVHLHTLKAYFSLLNVRPPGLWGGSGAADQDAQQEVLQLGQCSGEMLWCCWEQLLCAGLSTVLKEVWYVAPCLNSGAWMFYPGTALR